MAINFPLTKSWQLAPKCKQLSHLLTLIQTRRQHRFQGLSSSLHPLPPRPPLYSLDPTQVQFSGTSGILICLPFTTQKAQAFI